MNQTQKIRKKYDRIAQFYDLLSESSDSYLFAKTKNQILPKLNGKILEVGIGTGKNIKYYNNEAQVTGIDFSTRMLEKAKKKLAISGKKNVTLKQMDVQNLRFKDDSFDYVITTCVFCSVPDPLKGLKEIQRVLKPTGRLMMIEHVLSNNKFIAFIEHIHNPISKFLMGVNINRDTKKNIQKAGLKLVEDKNLALYDVVRLFVAKKGKRA